MAIYGGCLCGGVRYAINGRLLKAGNCHCSMCRRQHGAAFSTYAEYDPEAFEWMKGEDLLQVYETSPGNGWCFCSRCGSSLMAIEKGVAKEVALGTVDGDPGIRPGYHIFTGSRAPWHEIEDDLPQYDEWPGGTS